MFQQSDVGWLRRWTGGYNRSSDVRMSHGLSGCPSVGFVRLTSVPTNRPVLVRMANKQGKNGTCTASDAGGSLWRPFGSVWRFRPRKSSPRSLYLCPQATGRTTGLPLRRVIGSLAIRLRTDFYVRRNIARCVSRNKKCDCNLLNNRFLKKESITMGNDIEMSEPL